MSKVLKVLNTCADEKYVKDIVTDYDILSERCQEIDIVKQNKEAQNIILNLKNTIRAIGNITGLSANQIGFNKRILCLNFEGKIKTFINPIITSTAGFELSKETCHSLPKTYAFIRPRYSRIKVTYQSPTGNIECVELMGMAAKVMQHHIDHLDGLLLSDVSLEIDKDFEEATEEERNEVINMYLDSIDLNAEKINASIESDEEAKKLADGIKFMTAVQSGNVILESVNWTDEEIAEYEQHKAEIIKETK